MSFTQNKHFTLEKVKDGIYAAIAKEGSGAVANAGFMDLGYLPYLKNQILFSGLTY